MIIASTRSHLLYRTKSHGLRQLSNSSPKDGFKTAEPHSFPTFLKNIESKWKMKLVRRHDRERYFGSKEEEHNATFRYVLSMFPYSSGRLHLGHVRTYTSADILARFSKLLQKNERSKEKYTHVINPMGFDSFGLPADNAARERGLDPAVWTNTNIRSMKQQLDDLGLQFDWREATSNPSYYKWTQHIFLKLYNAGLIYKGYSEVNWDPIDKTVLADEQVDDDGRSWRSGAKVERRICRQWFVKTNAFVESIYKAEDIDPESWRDILAIQRGWTGEPCGWLFYLPLESVGFCQEETLLVFTKNPELFLDETAKLVIDREHWLEKVHKISLVKTIKNPFTGKRLEVHISNSSDELPQNCRATISSSHDGGEDLLKRDQVLLHAKLNRFGGHFTSSSYRDWLVSRQRVWGTPIPMLHCSKGGYCPCTEESLPITLPKTSEMDYSKAVPDPPEYEINNPLQNFAPASWLQVHCPNCGKLAQREGETLDTLFDSSWYFLRYASSPSSEKPFEPKLVQPVWCYVGGKEHASMHLAYARFMTHFLHSRGEINFKEPFNKLLVQGMVKGKTYKLNGQYISSDKVAEIEDMSKLTVEYEKMSKSKGNGVDPTELLDKYGMDATRFCLMNYANPRSERLWRSTEEEFKDVLIFLRKICLLTERYVTIGNDLLQGKPTMLKELSQEELESAKAEIRKVRNKCADDSMFHMENTFQIRQFISVLHVLSAFLKRNLASSVVYTEEFAGAFAALIIMLNPIVPHLSEELWSHFSRCSINPLRNKPDSEYKTDLQASDQPWPLPDGEIPERVIIHSSKYDSRK